VWKEESGDESHRDETVDDEVSDDLLVEEEDDPEEEYVRPGWLAEMPFWAISALLHLVLGMIIIGVIYSEGREEKPPRKPLTVAPSKPPPPYDPKKKRDLVRKVKIPQPKIVQIPVVPLKIDEITTEVPKGTSFENQTNLNLDSHFLNDAIGLSGGAAGAYGSRLGKGSLRREGGGEDTESAVRAALEWLVRHQGAAGGWSGRSFTEECKKTCRNRDTGRFGIGNSVDGNYDVGLTALAVLAFTGAGNSHRSASDPRYARCLRRAMDFLLRKQILSPGKASTHGRIGSGSHHKVMYEHSIATMALCELLLLSNDRLKLLRPARAATEYCLASRNPGSAWRYGFRDGNNDTSVAGWFILALKTAKISGVGIDDSRYDEAFRDTLRFFDRVTDTDGVTGYTSSRGERGTVPTMTSVAALCRMFAGQKRTSSTIRASVKHLLQSPPQWTSTGQTVDFYYWYYATYAAFQMGSTTWRKWNPKMKKALLSSQRRGGCEDGSWDTCGPWSRRAGRVYSTALAAMTLEVYYRFERTTAGSGFLKY